MRGASLLELSGEVAGVGIEPTITDFSVRVMSPVSRLGLYLHKILLLNLRRQKDSNLQLPVLQTVVLP